ncbi:MAG: hypothetical protein AAGJ35_10425, partial [Myxococcota bacterium]
RFLTLDLPEEHIWALWHLFDQRLHAKEMFLCEGQPFAQQHRGAPHATTYEGFLQQVWVLPTPQDAEDNLERLNRDQRLRCPLLFTPETWQGEMEFLFWILQMLDEDPVLLREELEELLPFSRLCRAIRVRAPLRNPYDAM